MKLNVLIFKNVAIGAFTSPVFDDHNPLDAAEQLRRSIIIEKDLNVVNRYKNLELYKLGTFDDLSGELITHKPELLLNCVEVVKGREDYVESQPISRKD